MITVNLNLIRGGLCAADNGQQEVLCEVQPVPRFVTNLAIPFNPSTSRLSSAGLPPSLHPRLMERLLGKSPLRLVLARIEVDKGVWKEKLECGHETTTFQEFVWAENNSLVRLEPTAKRRRCQKCKPIVAPVLKATAEITADQQRAELVHKQKLKFGSLFEALCFSDGTLRPGELAEPLPSPKKPVQSIKRASKEDIA